MKKIFLLFTFFFATSAVFAQLGDLNIGPEEMFKAVKKNATVELGFIPFSQTIPISISQLRARYFITDHLAARLGVNLSTKSNKKNWPGDITTKSSVFIMGIYPGMEYHIGKLKRLSPYFGAELNIYYKGYKYVEKTDGNETLVISGAWDDTYTKCGWTDLGLNALVGVDFYISQHIYLGVEMYYGFAIRLSHEVNRKVPEPSTVIVKKGTMFNLVGNAVPAIRLGWAL